MSEIDSLATLGWRSHFQAQIDANEPGLPMRVMSVHRSRVELAGQDGRKQAELHGRDVEADLAVGDWVLFDSETGRIVRRLQAFGVFQRRGAGTRSEIQTIAANVDTLFVVTSANRDFNVARLERYLALAQDAGAFPIIVISKADMTDSIDDYVREARALAPGILVEKLDTRDAEQVAVLKSWCSSGQTVAVVGSSGVGKSTLINTLTGSTQVTNAARDDDQRGRHTTTRRSMHPLPDGGWLIDTPGMRELQLAGVGDALHDVFSDVTSYAEHCKFKDCAHESEPGCRVQEAIASGDLDAERLRRFRKLQNEDRRNSESLFDRRARDKSLGKFYKSVQSGSRQRKEGN